MGTSYSIGEVIENAANGLVDTSQEIAEAAKQAYCTLYYGSPFAVIYNNTVTSPIVNKAMSKLCGAPPPTLPPPPFSGGQCEGVQYEVSVEWRQNEGNLIETTRIVWGTVKGFEPEEFQTGWRMCIKAGGQFDPGVSNCNSVSFVNGSDNPFSAYQITGVVRVDGQPDDCGDPPSEWYPEIPPPTDIDITSTVSITNIDNQTTEYNVSVNRDGDQYIRFPAVLNVSGVSVGIDVTGISVGEINIGRRSGGGGGASRDNGDSITQEEDGEGADVETEKLPEEEVGDSKEETVDKLVALEVYMTLVPGNAKTVTGRGAPDLIYGGWIEFQKDGLNYPRQFIDFRNSYYPAPDKATGYAITVKDGYRANVVKVVEKVPLVE